MSLFLAGSRDHALLTMVIQEARNLADRRGGYLGRTALQKILYFLQVTGVPMDYHFDIYHYGPFCDTISRDVDWLMADEVIVDQSKDRSKYSSYAPGPAATELVALYAEELERERGRIRTLIEALLPKNLEDVELMATLDYLYRQQKATNSNGSLKDEVIHRLLLLKGERFTREKVAQTYDAMARVGIFA